MKYRLFFIVTLLAYPFVAPATEKPWQPADQLFAPHLPVLSATTDIIPAGDEGTIVSRDHAINVQINRDRTQIRIAFFNQRTTKSAPTTSNSGLPAITYNLPQPFS